MEIIIDPLSIATQGIYSDYTPYSIITQGYYVEIEIIDLPTGNTITNNNITGIYAPARKRNKKENKKKDNKQSQQKLIKVSCHINNKIYYKSKVINNINVTVEDINIEIDDTLPNKPKIKILFK